MVVPLFLLLLTVTLSGAVHECERECVIGDNRTCLYDFRLQEYHTLSRACYNCPEDLADCLREECIVGDGVKRPLLTVNRQLPGPSLQVCEGDRVVVDLYNSQLSDTETVHWHGLHMKDQQYYDGVPYLTQCPVLGSTFRYDFLASNPGTHLWHSHVGLHRGSGVFGSLVIRQAEDPHRGLYDTDLLEHVIVLSDWSHESIASKYAGRHHSTDDDYARSILINGKGRNTAAQMEGVEEVALPLEVVQVTPELRHRLRFISGTGLNCPIIVSVDSHPLTIIAIDGDPIVPFTTDSFVIYSGERFDVVLEANQPVDNYWIRFTGLVDCEQMECVQGAVLRYEAALIQDPTTPLIYDPSYPPGVVVNPLNSAGDDPEEVTMAELSGLTPTSLQETVDKQFYLGFDFRRVNNTLLYNPDLYPYNQDMEDMLKHAAASARTSPISPAEREMLLEIIQEEEKVIMDKRTDGKMITLKKQAWVKITETFNALNLGPKRSEAQIKKVWDRLKVKAKRDDALKKREERKTGGGAPPPKVPKESEKVLTILGEEVYDLGCPYDHDALSVRATSHLQGRLMQLTKFLIMGANSYCTSSSAATSTTFKIVAAQMDEERQVFVEDVENRREAAEIPPSPPPPERAPIPEKKSSGKRRRSLFDRDICAPENTRNGRQEMEERQRRLIERREYLVELQIQDMEVRLEEAKLLRDIAQKKLALLEK